MEGKGVTTLGEYLLEVQDLKTYFKVRAGSVRAVDGVSFSIKPGERVGVVGESGCGKSVTALSIMRLLPQPPAEYAGGSVIFEDQDLLDLPESAMRRIRGGKIGMIFQDPMTCLNPTMPVGKQIAEGLSIHLKLSKAEGLKRAVSLLEQVGIPAASERVNSYPHQFSGGMRQRVMIAMALACNPKLLIADEPTTALDVTIQAQILDLMRELKRKIGAAIILITHDLGVVAEMAQRVVVMYAGRKVEEAPVKELFRRPRHPYTLGLLASVPRLGATLGRRAKLEAIAGVVPSLLGPPPGCRFAPRCRLVTDACRIAVPALREVAPGHKAACILA